MRTIMILGSTGTIGKGLVEHFKNENIIEASRSLQNKENQFHLDLSEFTSIQDFLKKYKDVQVDVLFVNSGLVCEKKLTKDGVDMMWMVNAFGVYYLVKHFLKSHQTCKIIITTSISILHAHLDFHPKKYHQMYRNTKLLEYFLIRNIQQMYPQSIISFAHPGIVPTKLSLSLHCKMIQFWISHFGNSLENAVSILVYAEEHYKEGYWVSPKSFFSLKGKPKLKKIKLKTKFPDYMMNEIVEKEKEFEEKYGI